MGLHFLFVFDSSNATTTVGVHEEEDVQGSTPPQPFPSIVGLPEEYVMLST